MTDFDEQYEQLLTATSGQGDNFRNGVQALHARAQDEKNELWALFFAALLDHTKQEYEAAQKKYDRLLQATKANSGAPLDNPQASLIANTWLAKGFCFGEQIQATDQIEAFDRLISGFGHTKDYKLKKRVALALVNKGIALGEQQNPEKELAAYEEVITRLREATETGLIEIYANALVLKGGVLFQQQKSGEELAAYNEVISRFRDAKEIGLIVQVANALVNKGVVYAQQQKFEEARIVFEEVISRYREATQIEIKERVAMALVYKGIVLSQQKNPAEELLALEEVISRYRDENQTALKGLVAKAFVNKGITLGQQKNREGELAAYEEVIFRYRDEIETGLKVQVAMALVGKGVVLGLQQRLTEGLASCEEVIARYADARDSTLMIQVVNALWVSAWIYEELKNPTVALNLCDRIVSKYKNETDIALKERVNNARRIRSRLYTKVGNQIGARASWEELIAELKKEDNIKTIPVLFESYLKCGALYWVNNESKYYGDLEPLTARYNQQYSKLNKKEYSQLWPDGEPLYEWIARFYTDLHGSIFRDQIQFQDFLYSLVYLALTVEKMDVEVVPNSQLDNPPDKPKYYCHYTKLGALRSILSIDDKRKKPEDTAKAREKSNALRFGSLEYVNDPREGLALVDQCKDCTDRNCMGDKESGLIASFFDNEIDPEISSRMYGLCFTETSDRLDHWRLYANDGDGISISIPLAAFAEVDPNINRMASAIVSAKPKQKVELEANGEVQKIDSTIENNGVPLTMPKRVMYDIKSKKAACNRLKDPLQRCYRVWKALKGIADKKDVKDDPSKQEEAKKVADSYRKAVQGILLEILYLFKSEEYRTEMEHRILVFQPDLKKAEIDESPISQGKPPRVFLKSEPVLFEKKGYKLCIGPKVPKPRLVQLELDYRLTHHGLKDNVEVSISTVKYR